MKLLTVNIAFHPPNSQDAAETKILATAEDLSDFSFFNRSGVREVITFGSRLIAMRTQIGTRQQVPYKDKFFIYCQRRANGLCALLVTDKEYPPRIAFSATQRMLGEFEKVHLTALTQVLQQSDGHKQLEENGMPCDSLQTLLDKFQDPKNDDLTKIKDDLEETKTIMNEAFENVLGREEKLKELVDKSGDLSIWTKSLYDESKDDSCCSVQ